MTAIDRRYTPMPPAGDRAGRAPPRRPLRLALGPLVIALVMLASGKADAAPDYAGMIDRIEAFMTEAVTLHRNGDIEGAKGRIQQSYFEVFENLEGPIRVNVSARRNSELEAAFGEIRKMILRGDSPEAVAARVAAHIAELRALLPKLLNGVELKAEAGDGVPGNAVEAATPAPARTSHPHWLGVVDGIAAGLERAVTAYGAGDNAGARALVQAAQFDGYKNSLLETAIRRHVSQRQEAEYNSEFVRIAGLIRDGQPLDRVRASVSVLIEDLRRTLPGVPLVDGLRTGHDPEPTAGTGQEWQAVAADITGGIGQAIALYRQGQKPQAVAMVQGLYFDGFEASGMEARIGARDTGVKTALESRFSRIAALMKAGAAPAEIEAELAAMNADFTRAVALLADGGDSLLALFLYSLLIILREGIEALLIVAAILAYLARTGNQDKRKVIHGSVMVALGASILTAILLEGVLQASAASKEVLEGATMLVAAAVLFSMSFWLISKAEARKWMAYIKHKVDHSLSSGSLSALWFASFLAVFREGAETVLFYRALTINASASGTVAIAAGFGVGCLLLAGLYVAMHAGAMKLPIRPFFMATGSLLYALAFVFAGKGMMELVEGKVLEPTLVPWLPELPLLGIYPYWQTVAPQILLLLATLFGTLVLLLRPAPAGSAGEVNVSPDAAAKRAG